MLNVRDDEVPVRDDAFDDVTGPCDVVFVADLVNGEGSLEIKIKIQMQNSTKIKFQIQSRVTTFFQQAQLNIHSSESQAEIAVYRSQEIARNKSDRSECW